MRFGTQLQRSGGGSARALPIIASKGFPSVAHRCGCVVKEKSVRLRRGRERYLLVEFGRIRVTDPGALPRNAASNDNGNSSAKTNNLPMFASEFQKCHEHDGIRPTSLHRTGTKSRTDYLYGITAYPQTGTPNTRSKPLQQASWVLLHMLSRYEQAHRLGSPIVVVQSRTRIISTHRREAFWFVRRLCGRP